MEVMPSRWNPRTLLVLGTVLLLVAALAIWFAFTRPDANRPARAPGEQTPTSSPAPATTEPDPATDAAPSPRPTPTPSPSPTPPSADEIAGVLTHEVPHELDGELVVLPGREPAPDPDREVRTVRIEMEWGLPIYLEDFADFVMDTLNDDRSWGGDGSLSFARTDGEDPDLRVLVASPGTVDAMCAPLATNSEYSCGRYGHAALNAERWINGADPFTEAGGSITEYRRYMVNHEVGHLLGHQHRTCPAAGELAPVMVQQTITLGGCEPNGWAFP